MHSRSGPTGLRDCMMAMNIPAPCPSTMYQTANKVGKLVVEHSKKDLESHRQQLKEIKALRGLGDDTRVDIETDCCYNNEKYSGVFKTPFQAGTQVACVMAENVTGQKSIIGVVTKNKLCAKGARHGFKGPNHPGHCSADLAQGETIGNEQQWAKEATMPILDAGLWVSHVTTDPDGKAGKGVQEACRETNSNIPEHLMDTRHMSSNQRKKVNKETFSEDMLPGNTKAEKEKMQKRLANNVTKRCEFEFQSSFDHHAGDVKLIQRDMKHFVPAILNCYQGEHEMCRRMSYACRGNANNTWLDTGPYLSKDFKLTCTDTDIDKLMSCIEFKLGENALKSTKLNTNTQKSEATVRSLRRSIPKPVTYTRNYKARIHAAVHSVNWGTAESISRLRKAAACPVTANTKVALGLKTRQRADIQRKNHKKLQSTKKKENCKNKNAL